MSLMRWIAAGFDWLVGDLADWSELVAIYRENCHDWVFWLCVGMVAALLLWTLTTG